MKRFEGRVCLVTGSTGIAAAAARAMADEGGRVFVVSKTADHAIGLADEFDAGWAAGDLTQEEAVESAVRACIVRFGRIDAVYNVAGISGRRFGDGPLHEMTLDGWRTVIDNNATSIALVCRAAIRQMLTQEPAADGRRGVLLNMSSVLARRPEPGHFATHAYAASKGAIEALTRSAAAYYAKDGIRINAIAPGLVATPMSQRAQTGEGIVEFAKRKQPFAEGGLLKPEDLVGTALYLLSDESRMVTGQVIDVDAGWGLS
ncbi:MAG TPA: SDR family oxidoreductase [Candidatus Limnocylindrales bacterium]|nr:SDR family oxidoreductase [Candidatus Limnocylindrales bacterium]